MSTEIAKEMCDTCIFRPGNLMRLREGRLAELIAETDRRDSNVSCHENLDEFCAGSVARRPGQMARIIRRLESRRTKS